MMTAAERQRAYCLRHPDEVKARVAKYQESEKGKRTIAAYNRSDARREALKKYNNSAKARAAKARYRKTDGNRAAQARYDATPTGILARSLRDRVRKILKRGKGKRAGSAIADLGCTVLELRAHIESQFAMGMSWENYGEWHIDHIKPLAMFDLTNRDHFLEAVNYANLQPLWARDNLLKAARHG